VLRDHQPESSEKWEFACEKNNIECLAINALRNDWLEILNNYNPDFCLSRPPGDIQLNKRIFDEKIFFIENYTDYKVFPGFLATYIYENKSALAWFLKTNQIPHPGTFVTSRKDEALGYIDTAYLPIVAKTLIGAAGSGVKIIRSKQEAKGYIQTAFKAGIRRRLGPNRKTGTPTIWFQKAVKSPAFFFKKLKQYKERNRDVQKDIVLFQEYIPHEYEWRCVKIGDSYFAYKKLKIGSKASGAKQFEYGSPPLELLDFTKNLCEKYNFHFMAVDLFYSNNQILVNELQTIFGHKNPYLCKVDGKHGRYVHNNNQWEFEEGDFNTNESYDLRLETALKGYKNNS